MSEGRSRSYRAGVQDEPVRWYRSELDQTRLRGAGECVGAVGCTELREYGTEMEFDGPLGDAECSRDAFVAQPARELLQNILLPRRQLRFARWLLLHSA